MLRLGASEDAHADQDKANALADEIRPLQHKIDSLRERASKPTQLVQQAPVAEEDLQAKLEQLQDELANKRKALADKIALASVAPAIHETLQKTEILHTELAAPAEQVPIEKAELAIHDLEEHKKRLESLLQQLPEGAEGDELRNKTEWNLNSLRDLLNRLSETVGEKVKAIAAFLASKKEAENQLSQLRDQLGRIEADQMAGGQSPEALRNQLETLGAEEQRLNKLKEQLEAEHHPENLDEDKRQELEALKRDIEAASEHLRTVRENIQASIQKALDSEKLRARAGLLNNDLANLTEQGRRTLNDAAVIPQTYTNLADQLYEAINNAMVVITETAPAEPASEVVTLQETVAEAQPVHQALATRAAIWEQFVKERENANVQLDDARRPLDEIEAKGPRTLPEAQQDLEAVVSGQEQLSPLDTTLENLQRLSEQLDPLETAYADVRFFDVDLEQTREQYEDLLTSLRSEIDDENALADATQQVQNELTRLRQHAQTADKDVLTQLEQHELPALLAQAQLLVDRDQTARHERRIVQRPEASPEKALLEQLNQLAQEISQHIKDISLAEQQQAVETLRLRLEALQSQTAPTEEAIQQVAFELEALPSADVAALQKALADVRAQKEQRDSLKRRLQDELNEVAEKLQRIEDSTGKKPEEKPQKKKKGKKPSAPELAITPAERKERIQTLSTAITELDNQLIPKLAEIQKESLDNEIEVAGLEPQQQKAAKLVEILNNELAEKEAEQAAVAEALKKAEDLKSIVQSVEEQLQVPVSAILSLADAEEERKRTAESLDRLKADLQQFEPPRGLDQESLEQLKTSEELAKSELAKLTERLGALEKQADLIGQLEDKKNDAEKQLDNLKTELDALQDKYAHGPVALVSAEDDLRRAESTKNRLADFGAFLNGLKDWLAQQMPGNEPAIEELDARQREVEELARRLEEIRQPLVDQVAAEQQLLNRQAELDHQLAELENQATAESLEPSAVAAIQSSLKPIREQLEKLEEEAKSASHDLVQHGDLLNLPSLAQRLDHLQQVLEQAEDARKAEAAKMALARLSGQIAKETGALRQNLERATRIEEDPNAAPADLDAAIALLANSDANLGALEDLYNQLDEQNPEQNAVLQQAKDDQSHLGESVKNLSTALQDRADALRRFNDSVSDIEDRLRKIREDVEHIEPESSQALDNLAPLVNEEAELARKLNELADNSLPDLKPLQQPAARVQEVQKTLADIDEAANKVRNAAEAALQKQQAVDEFVGKLEQLEDTLRSLERRADEAPLQTEALKPLVDEVEASLVEPLKQLETAPTDELKSRARALKERTTDLGQRLNDNSKFAKNQEDLLDSLNSGLEAAAGQLAQLQAKYQVSPFLIRNAKFLPPFRTFSILPWKPSKNNNFRLNNLWTKPSKTKPG